MAQFARVIASYSSASPTPWEIFQSPAPITGLWFSDSPGQRDSFSASWAWLDRLWPSLQLCPACLAVHLSLQPQINSFPKPLPSPPPGNIHKEQGKNVRNNLCELEVIVSVRLEMHYFKKERKSD